MSTNSPLIVIDRVSRQPIEEEVLGEWWLRLLYGETVASKTLGRLLLHALIRWPVTSWVIGKYYDTKYSKGAIAPFCKRFHIDTSEHMLPLDQFTSFNDFFTRRLHPDVRPQDQDPNTITIPADGRYSFIPILYPSLPIPVKNQYLCLDTLLMDKKLAARFYEGKGVICRLCPADYHRFFFPISGKVGTTNWIHGSLFSVNPIATSRFPWIFWENRRAVTLIETEKAGSIAYIEVGATNCGSISQEFIPNSKVKKGQEKGFFRLGGSAIILLFEPHRITFADDLIDLASSSHEVLCRIGQPMATIVS